MRSYNSNVFVVIYLSIYIYNLYKNSLYENDIESSYEEGILYKVLWIN